MAGREKESLISVIVPVYDVEAYLPKCLDSLLAQTWQNFELLLVDDGSPDGSEKGKVLMLFWFPSLSIGLWTLAKRLQKRDA